MKKQLLILTTALLSINVIAQVPNYVPTNGLVGWWPFNGNANDESGNGNNGTVNGATLTADRFGAAGKAYGFDGISNYIEVPSSPGLSVSATYSISVWSYISSFNSGGFPYQPAIVSKIDGGDWYGGFEIRASSDVTGGPKFLSTSGNIGGNNFSPAVPNNNINEWYNIIATYDGSMVRCFINGVCMDSIGISGNLQTSTIPLRFGRRGGGPSFDCWFTGLLDDIGIWNRALTQCEIQDLYNAELNSLAVSGGLDQTLCEGQSTSLFGTGASTYSWSNNVNNGVGFVPTTTTNYIVTGTDANGCLGADTVTIVVNANTSSTQTQTALDSYTWPVNGQTYTQSGTYSDTLVNAAGCDSIVTLNLTMSYTGIEELNPSSSKKLLRITDLSGKETPFRKNTVLLFIYEDGTVERVFVGE
jgi:hypothetical protein